MRRDEANALVGPFGIEIREEGRERRRPPGGSVISARVGPLGEQGADEALGLAVRAGAIGPGEELPDPGRASSRGVDVTVIGFRVVRHHALDANTPAPIPPQRAVQKAGDGDRGLVGQKLDVREARCVINRPTLCSSCE